MPLSMPLSVDLNHPCVSLKELVEKQNSAVQRVLEIQAAISRRLDTEPPVPIAHPVGRHKGNERMHSKDSARNTHTFRSQISGGSDMAVPLISPISQRRISKTLTLGETVTPNEAQPPNSGSQSPAHGFRRRPTTLFPDAALLKQRVIDHLHKPEYHVEDFYKTEGLAQYWARSSWFRNATMFIIFINTLWIAVDTDYNDALYLTHSRPIFIIMDNFFCIAFSFEITVRFLAFARKCNCLRDYWFVFDFALVALMVWETWIELLIFSVGGGRAASVLRIFKILRLTRIARLARLLRNAPEVMILLKGLGIAMRSVVATLSLLLLIIYIFAVAFTQTFADSEWAEGKFKTVPTSMNTLMKFGVFPEGREFLESMFSGGAMAYLFSVLFLVMTSLTILNMLIGVICEVVSVTAEIEKEEMLLHDMREKINMILGHHVSDHYGNTVSKSELAALLDSQEAIDIFDSVGVDIFALVDFVDFIFPGDDELEVTEFIKTIIRFRGSNKATVKDVVDMRMFLTNEIQNMLGFLIANMSKKK